MSISPIKWCGNRLKLIDQTKLPIRLTYVECDNIHCVWQAIRKMQIRGAPLIGIAAGFGLYLGIKDSKAEDFSSFRKEFARLISYLSKTRPTAVNLFSVLEKMRNLVDQNQNKPVSELKKMILSEAMKLLEEDRKICRRMGDWGQTLIKNGDRILTYCNAGALATAEYGTALGAIYRAKEKGKHFKVFVCETRPFLQGARLTSWELKQNKIPATLICDNMAASLMQEGRIDKVIVGADRIVLNGDVANKIGTYNLAVLAKFHKIPFYVVAPLWSFDFQIKKGTDIPIEERPESELVEIFGRRIAPKAIKIYNPAFDVTPARLITAIITEYGIIKPCYVKRLGKVRELKELKEFRA